MYKEQPIGRKMIYPYDDFNRARSVKYADRSVYPSQDETINLENFDISSICKGHFFYRNSLDKILEAIDFDF